MADIPTADQVGTATTWFTSQAGITATVLAFVSIVLFAYVIWQEREHKKERAELRTELFGDKDRGVIGIVPSLMDKTESMRVEVWKSVDNMMALLTDTLNKVQEHRRGDAITQFTKLDNILDEVKAMSQSDLAHHNTAAIEIRGVSSALSEQSARLGDMVSLASRLAPPPWDGSAERRGKRRGR